MKEQRLIKRQKQWGNGFHLTVTLQELTPRGKWRPIEQAQGFARTDDPEVAGAELEELCDGLEKLSSK